ncbi:MAG: DHH family phosphoesterase [bacterium]|nr:DHH family phosphoesterase [bacterium]
MDSLNFDKFYEIKGVPEFLKLIKEAIDKKEKIILYGDADLDGSASVVILEEVLNFLGAKIAKIFFPDREKEGYGINEKSLLYLSKYAPGILISLDCGITNFKETSLAKKMGFRVWIIDHHEVMSQKPQADVVIDTKDAENPQDFFNLANAGLIFYLTRILLKELKTKEKDFETLFNSHIVLTMIATIADMMKVDSINQFLIDKGLELFPEDQRKGLRIISQKTETNERFIRPKIQKIISILNITKCKYHLTGTYRILNAKNSGKARELADELISDQKKRKEELNNFVEEIIKERRRENEINSEIVFAISKKCPVSFTGSIASKICGYYKKPTFIVSLNNDLAKGAVRVPHNLDSIEALKSVEEFLENFGGHKAAAGFSSKKENLEKIREELENYFITLKK